MQMRELPHYTIGDSYGGNQDWFTEPWMNRGGCGALTACDMSIYLARYMGRSALYPFDPERITRFWKRRRNIFLKKKRWPPRRRHCRAQRISWPR